LQLTTKIYRFRPPAGRGRTLLFGDDSAVPVKRTKFPSSSLLPPGLPSIPNLKAFVQNCGPSPQPDSDADSGVQMQSSQIVLPSDGDHVPDDILAEIFVRSLAGEPTVYPPDPLQPHWVPGSVCSQWRRIMLTQPRLWRVLSFSTDRLRAEVLRFRSRCRRIHISRSVLLRYIFDTYRRKLYSVNGKNLAYLNCISKVRCSIA